MHAVGYVDVNIVPVSRQVLTIYRLMLVVNIFIWTKVWLTVRIKKLILLQVIVID